MIKLNKRTEILALILVVTLAPASIAFAQTASVESETSTGAFVDAANTKTDAKIVTKAEINAKLAEKRMDNIRDEIKFQIRDVVSVNEVDRRPDLTFRGNTDGWAIIGGKAIESSIALGGDAHHLGGGNWKIKSEGELTVGDRHAKMELTGFARGNMIYLQGSGALDNGEAFRVVMRGHFAPTTEDNVYAIAFTNAGIHYSNNGIRIPLMQVGSVIVVDTTPTEPLTAQQ